MQNEKQIQFLKDNLEEAINSLYKRRKDEESKAYRLQMSTTILSSITTVILGLKLTGFEETTRITALIISSLITIISAVETFWSHKKLWRTYAETLHGLYTLRFDFEFRLLNSEELKSEELIHFKNRYQEILESSNEKWMKSRAKEEVQK